MLSKTRLGPKHSVIYLLPALFASLNLMFRSCLFQVLLLLEPTLQRNSDPLFLAKDIWRLLIFNLHILLKEVVTQVGFRRSPIIHLGLLKLRVLTRHYRLAAHKLGYLKVSSRYGQVRHINMLRLTDSWSNLAME